jgi:hypothetical protein
MPTTQRSRASSIQKVANALGYYWASEYPATELRALCRAWRGGTVKVADLGGDNESGFEQAFSALAYSYLRDSAPRLLPYIIGFQLIDRNEDNTKAAGVFGFKIGKQWLYAPVFFINNDLKGHELLYVKNQDLFVPMKENWINYLLSRKPQMLGETSPRDAFQLGGLAPNVERLAYPPSNSKFGADMQEWAREIMPMVAALATKEARFLWPDRPRGEKFDLDKLITSPNVAIKLASALPDFETFLGSDWRLARTAYAWSQRYPGIKLALDRFYGPDLFSRIGLDLETQAASILPRESRPADWTKAAADSILPVSLMEKKAVSSDKIHIITRPELTLTRNVSLNDADKSHIVSHGYLVKDERTGDEISMVYNTQHEMRLLTPDQTGIYEVLEAPGDFSRMLVITAPISNAGPMSFSTVIRLDDGDKTWLNGPLGAINARPREETEDTFEKYFAALPEKETLEEGATYVAVTCRGGGTVPFEVRKHIAKEHLDTYKVDFLTSAASRGSKLWQPLTSNTRGNFDNYVSTYDATLIRGDRPDTRLMSLNGELHVPAEARFIKIKAPSKPKKDVAGHLGEGCCGECGSELKPIVPGDLAMIQMLFTEKTASLRLTGDEHEVTIDSKAGSDRFSYGQALFNLIRVHGVTEPAAHEMLKTAQVRHLGGETAGYRIKYADNYPLQQSAPTAPAFPAPIYGTEPIGYRSVASIYPQQETLPVPALDSSRTDPRIYDPFLNITPDTQSLGFAQQAAVSGQKEVFDTSMMANLLKTVQHEDHIDKDLGEFMKAMNARGRLLLTFYWHGEAMEDRYSRAVIADIVDALRNVFESEGDLILQLRQNSGADVDDLKSQLSRTAEA